MKRYAMRDLCVKEGYTKCIYINVCVYKPAGPGWFIHIKLKVDGKTKQTAVSDLICTASESERNNFSTFGNFIWKIFRAW